MTIQELREAITRLKAWKHWKTEDTGFTDDIQTLLSSATAVLKVLEMEDSQMEFLAEKVHKAYCDYYKTQHSGEEYWTRGDYSKLKEDGKEYDRVTIRAILLEVKEFLMG